MIKILFVCTGNTCRSPMAEAIFNTLVKDSGILSASSAGVYADGISPISSNSKRVLLENNIDFEHTSRPVTDELLKESDLVICMTSSHEKALKAMFPEYSEKIETLGVEIFDPYGGDINVYRECFKQLYSAMKATVDYVKFRFDLSKIENVRNSCFEYFVANHSHLKAVSHVELLAFDNPLSQKELSEFFNGENKKVIVVTYSSKSVAYLAFCTKNNSISITRIAVIEEFRRLHVGENLLKVLYSSAKSSEISEITIEVDKNNTTALTFFNKMGYKENNPSEQNEAFVKLSLTL